jgi:hypothetical protein
MSVRKRLNFIYILPTLVVRIVNCVLTGCHTDKRQQISPQLLLTLMSCSPRQFGKIKFPAIEKAVSRGFTVRFYKKLLYRVRHFERNSLKNMS